MAYMSMSFSQLHNTPQVDLWPFFTSPVNDSRLWIPLQDLRQKISCDIAASFEICGLPTPLDHVTRGKVSDQAVFFRYLTHHIPQWLANTTLLGRYAITGERYTVALLHISRYLLRLPKDQLAAIRNDDHRKFSNSMTLAWRTFRICMVHLPLSIDLYFFVLYMYSVIADPRQASDKVAKIATSAKAYLLLVSTRYSLLMMYH